MAGKPRTKIDFDKIYESNTYGPFKIIEDLGRDERSRLYVKIKFLNTGNEIKTRYDIAISGKVRDELYGIDFNQTYISLNYGPFKIISFQGMSNDSRKIVRIKFLNTGYECDVFLKNVINGNVKDHSIGYHDRGIAITPYTEEYNSIITKILKQRWKGMMDRCYQEKAVSFKKYGALGVTVCDFWKNFDNFINSIHLVPNFYSFYYDPTNYQLDKDYLQLHIPRGNRVYSPQTCIFLSNVDNSNLSILQNHTGFYGVTQLKSGNYKVEFSIDGKKKSFGVYSNYIAALNEYNYYYTIFSKAILVKLLNYGIPYMDHSISLMYLVDVEESSTTIP